MSVHLTTDTTTRRPPLLQPYVAGHSTVSTRRCCCGRRGGFGRASTWSHPAIGSLLLLVTLSLPVAETARLWGLGGGGTGRQQRAFVGQSNEPDDGDMDEVFAKLQQEQFWEGVEHAGMGVLEEEVKEKKSKVIFADVAKACSIGAQMTLIMGGGALLFRLLPVLLGHELEDEDEADATFPYLLQSSDHGSGRPQESLPAATTGGRVYQQLLTSGVEDPEGDATEDGEGEGGGERVGVGALGGAGAVEETTEGVGAVVVRADGGAVAASAAAEVTTGDSPKKERDNFVEEDADVVVNTRRRAAIRKARRLSRPFLKAMGPPLVLLLVARLALGTILASRIDPTLELLFGDDIIDLYSANKKVVHKVDMPYPKDADDVPGRKKMKGKRVQRPPRPEGEEDGEAGAWEPEGQPEVGL